MRDWSPFNEPLGAAAQFGVGQMPLPNSGSKLGDDANFDGYAGCAEESQTSDVSGRTGPTQYCKKADYSDSGNRAAARRFGAVQSIRCGGLKTGMPSTPRE